MVNRRVNTAKNTYNHGYNHIILRRGHLCRQTDPGNLRTNWKFYFQVLQKRQNNRLFRPEKRLKNESLSREYRVNIEPITRDNVPVAPRNHQSQLQNCLTHETNHYQAPPTHPPGLQQPPRIDARHAHLHRNR